LCDPTRPQSARTDGAPRQLGDLIGLTRQTVVAIEGDKYSPSLETAFRIALAFGVPLEAVFWYEVKGRR
jgi:putative transcriptional regulator